VTPRILKPLLVAGLLAATALAQTAHVAHAATWQPRASDRLIKLPGTHLEKAVENDFAKSPLAAEMAETGDRVTLKKETLADLQAAVEFAGDDTRIDLEHQFLSEKRRYIDLMSRQLDLRTQRARTKVRLYERLLGKLNAKQAAKTPQQAALLADQQAARARFQGSLSTVDAKLFQSTIAAESRYAQTYAKNMGALESLIAAVQAHPMNQAPELDGQPMTQGEYLRHLIAQNEADMALVDQERSILGYMARLVSLDALALSEDLAEPETLVAAGDTQPAPADAVDLFIPR
jgi:hypothetical protein